VGGGENRKTRENIDKEVICKKRSPEVTEKTNIEDVRESKTQPGGREGEWKRQKSEKKERWE
jgi:hypothetical protein